VGGHARQLCSSSTPHCLGPKPPTVFVALMMQDQKDGAPVIDDGDVFPLSSDLTAATAGV
jgi:hypothetical protein